MRKKLAFLIANKTSETLCSTSNLIKKPEQEKGAEKKASKRQLAWDWKKGAPVPEKKTQNWSNKGGKIARKVGLYRMFKAVISWQKR